MFKCALCGGEFSLFGNVLWCNECIEEFLAGKESMTVFVDRKKKEDHDVR